MTADRFGCDLGPRASPELGGRPRLLVLPLGATEQHGPHLPLDTDSRLASALARAAVARIEPPHTPWVAPTLPYGSSGEHAGFPGTLSMGGDALELVVVELVRSAGPEVLAVVLVDGHGGNRAATARAVERLNGEGRRTVAWAPRVAGGDAHAGRTETSLLLALCPELVRRERAEPGNLRPLGELWGELRAGGVAAVSANGVLGDPTRATAEEGRRLFERLVDDLERTLRATAASARQPPGGAGGTPAGEEPLE